MTLLPANASKLQYDLETVNQLSLDVDQAVQNLKSFKQDPPDKMLYWLVWEYGLEDILFYVPDQRRVIKEGLIWQRLRGTPESLKIALGWIGLDDATIEENGPGRHFYEYQVDPGKIITADDVSRLRGIAAISSPVRAKLARVYHDYDVRKLILSAGVFGQLLSDYSGVDEQDVRLSFGRRYQDAVTVGAPQIKASQTRTVVSYSRYEDRPLLSYMALDDRAHLAIQVRHGRLVSTGLFYDAQPTIEAHQRFSQAALVLSESDPLGSLQTLLGARRRVEQGQAFVLSQDALDTAWSIDWQPVNGLRLDNHTGALDATVPVIINIAEIRAQYVYALNTDSQIHEGRTRITLETPVLSGMSWIGTWDQRTWSTIGYTVIGVNYSGHIN